MLSLQPCLTVPAGWYAVSRVPRLDAPPERVTVLGTVVTVARSGGQASVCDEDGHALAVAEAFGLLFVHAGPDLVPMPVAVDRIRAAWPAAASRPGSRYEVDVPWEVPVSDFVNPQHTEPVHLTVSEPWQAVPGAESFAVTWSGSAPYVNLAPGRRWCLRVRADTRYDLFGAGIALLRISAPSIGVDNWIAQLSTPIDAGRCRLFFAYHAEPRQRLLRRLVPPGLFTFFARRVIEREVARDIDHWRQMSRPGYAFGPLTHDGDLLRSWLEHPFVGPTYTLGRRPALPASVLGG